LSPLLEVSFRAVLAEGMENVRLKWVTLYTHVSLGTAERVRPLRVALAAYGLPKGALGGSRGLSLNAANTSRWR